MSRHTKLITAVLRGEIDDNEYGFDRECVDVVMSGNKPVLEYFGVTIEPWGETEYLLQTSDCTNCGAYHLNCVDVERVCIDFREAMETAVMMSRDYGR